MASQVIVLIAPANLSRRDLTPTSTGIARRPQLPSHHVRPLVQQHGQIPVRLDPLGHQLAEQRLTRRPHDHRLGEFLPAGVRDHGELRAESFDVFCLTFQVRLRDEQRQVDVLGAGRLDARIDLGLHAFPQRIGVWPDHHGAAHRAVLGQFRLLEDLLVPPGEVILLVGKHTRAIADCHLTTLAGRQRPPLECRWSPAQ